MSETICPDCGERNVGRVEFCGSCGAFLAWDGPDDAPADPAPGHPLGAPTAAPAAPSATATPAMPAGPAAGPARVAPRSATSQPSPSSPAPAAAGLGQSAMRAYAAAAPALGAPVLGAQVPGPADPNRAGPPQPATQPVYQPPPEPPPPTESPCPRCGVVNDAALRFCRKCGLVLRGPVLQDDGGRPVAQPERLPWWQRWFRPKENTRRAARAAYRHSLPIRYQLIRWGLGLLGIGAVVGAVLFIGRNPVGFVTDQIDNLRGSLVRIDDLTAHSEPVVGTGAGATSSGGPAPSASAVPSEGAAPSGSAAPSGGTTPSGSATPGAVDSAPLLLDNRADTAWETGWFAAYQQDPLKAACVSPTAQAAPGAPGSVVLAAPQPMTVRQIKIWAGLPKDDARRPQQWRPKTIELAFSDGTCQQFSLQDVDTEQTVKVNPVTSTGVRLSVVDAFEPQSDQPVDQVAITDIRLYQRP